MQQLNKQILISAALYIIIMHIKWSCKVDKKITVELQTMEMTIQYWN